MYHVPSVVGGPIHDAVHPRHELQVFGAGGAFVDEENDKGSRNERHGDDDEDGDENVRTLLTVTSQTCSTYVMTSYELSFYVRVRHLHFVEGEVVAGSVHGVVDEGDPISSRVTLLRAEGGAQDGIVEGVEVGWDGMESFQVVSNLCNVSNGKCSELGRTVATELNRNI